MRKKLLLSLLLILGASVASFTAASYCTPTFDRGTPEGDYIARVLLTGNRNVLDNVTVGASSPFYTHYNTGVSLTGGQSYSITLRVGTFAGSTQSVAAWIDYNQNEIFEASEKLGESTFLGPDSYATFPFSVSMTGVNGTTRMRVLESSYGTSLNPCTPASIYGETEDYDIILIGMTAAPLLGGGNYRKIPIDNCPDGDISPTSYDGLCSGMSPFNGGVLASTGTATVTGSTNTTGELSSSTGNIGNEMTTGTVAVLEEASSDTCADGEEQSAYEFSMTHGITSRETCLSADMNGNLIRIDAAKMMVNFAMDVLDRRVDTSKKCVFNDMTNQAAEAQEYALKACQLGLMGLKGDGTPTTMFSPNELVNKAQFVTILSRLLYGESYNSKRKCRYCPHAQALKDASIITLTNDLMNPLKRGRAMIMLMRVTK